METITRLEEKNPKAPYPGRVGKWGGVFFQN
jgi:hypothetical protein